MTPLSPLYQTQAALDELMDFISTDEFVELPATERQPYLQKLVELIKAVCLCK